jgi:hypothetical protein
MRFLRRAIVGMQHQWLVLSLTLAPTGSFNQGGGLVATFTRMHFPRDQLATEQINDRIQIKEHAAHLAG